MAKTPITKKLVGANYAAGDESLIASCSALGERNQTVRNVFRAEVIEALLIVIEGHGFMRFLAKCLNKKRNITK
jgi:hypothetical protein